MTFFSQNKSLSFAPPTFLLCLLALSIPALALAQENVQIDARAEPRAVPPGGTLTYELEVAVDGNYDIHVQRPPDFDDFRIVSTFNAPSFVVRNGQATRSLRVQYQLQAPREEGNYEIAPPQVVVGSRTFTANPRTVRVSASLQAPSSQPSQPSQQPSAGSAVPSTPGNADAQMAFVDIVVEPERPPYVGEQLTLRYDLYVNQRFRGMRPTFPDDPALDDFWVEELQSRSRQTLRRRDGVTWQVTPIRTMAIFPLRPGPAVIDSLQVPIARTSFFSSGQTHIATGEPLEIEVQPLPDGAPDGFYEYNVGDWNMTVRVDSRSARVGGSLTLTATLDGIGRGNRLSAPELLSEEHFQVINRDDSFNKYVRGDRIGGTRTFIFHLMPLKEGPHSIPPLRFVFFDPQLEEYKVLESAPISIQVEPGEIPLEDESPVASRGESEPAPTLFSELHPLLPEGALGPSRNPNPTLPFWVFLIPLVGLILLALESPLRTYFSARNAPTRKRRRLLQSVEELLAVDDGRPGPDLLLKALRLVLNDGLGASLGALTVDEVRQALDPMDLPEERKESIIALVDTLIARRYAPGSAKSDAELEAHTRALIQELLDRPVTPPPSNAAARAASILLLGALASLVASAPLTAQASTEPTPDWSARAPALAAEADAAEDPALDYNAGTAAAHAGDLGAARFYLERAVQRGANSREVRDNLNLVVTAVARQDPSVAAFPYQTINSTGFINLSIWLITLGLWLAIIAALLLRHFKKADFPHASALRTLLGLGLAAALLGSITFFSFQYFVGNPELAAVTAAEDLRAAPSEHAEALLGATLPPGAILRVSQTRDDWAQVELPSGARGWLPLNSIRVIR